MQAWVPSVIALLSLSLNLVLVLWINPRAERARWLRDQLVEHVIEILRISRDMRNNLRNPPVPAATPGGPTSEDTRWFMLKFQRDDWESVQPLLDHLPHHATDALHLLAPPALVEASRALTGARGNVLYRLKGGVDRNAVVYGSDYGELLSAWVNAEERFFQAARTHLGVQPTGQASLRQRILRLVLPG